MKIEVSEKKELPKDFVKIVFDLKVPESRFSVGKNGEETLVVKTSEKKDINRRKFILLCRQIVQEAKKHRVKKIAVDFSDLNFKSVNKKAEEIAEIAAENFEMANYEFVKYKTKPKEGWNFVEEIRIIAEKNNLKNIDKGIEKGKIVGEETNACREIANMPGGDMTPAVLVQEIGSAIQNTSIKMKVLEVAEMKKLGMGGILGVSRGSAEKPKFIILEYMQSRKEKPIVFIGKGITFDTGGLNVKPENYMSEMHMDMSGGAAVAHAMISAAKLGIKKKIVGLIPAAENMPSGESYRPGDILKTISGKTIEIANTDAEGRVVLADAHGYAERYNPKLVVNIATLTGAAGVALGERASALFSKSDRTADKIFELAEVAGDPVWQLPLWDEYKNDIKGNFGDVANMRSNGDPRYGGAIHAAMFLLEFAEKFPEWAHLDIGPRDTVNPDELLSKGASGVGVRLLVKILEKL
ncbi:MAG: leucyl aminopeptidase family protein [Candidatus Moranbacteria bacterium]|nr:leucyl aminopeptidase family protein [Candidatus Moranbacteria bacterium]